MFYEIDPTQAVPYEDIAKQPEVERAAANFIAKHYGEDVALSIRETMLLVIRDVFSGFPEDQTHEHLGAAFNVKQLEDPAETGETE
jgi:hypothetical protein